MNPLKVAIDWLLKKHVKEEKKEMSKIALVLSALAGVLANGAATNTLTVTVTDDAGAPLAGQAVALSGDISVAFSATNLTTDASGSATADLTSATAGTYQVTATLADGTTQSISVVFLAVPVTEQPAPEGPEVIDRTDLVLAKLKELVGAAGPQAHVVIDDLIELAKKLA